MGNDLFKGLMQKGGVPATAWLAAVILAAAIGGIFWLRGRSAQPATAAPPPTAQAASAPRPADAPLPPKAESDTSLRSLLADLSPSRAFHGWLNASDLLSRWVATTSELAEDVSPRRELSFLSPSGKFLARATKDGLEIAPREYARFDPVGDVAGSIDAKKVAFVYRSVHPLLQAAYHRLGYPDRDFDEATARALQRLCDAPVHDRPFKLERAGKLYLFADQALESLGPVEKTLLRMGPRNTRLIQQSAREIATALGMPLHHSPQATQ